MRKQFVLVASWLLAWGTVGAQQKLPEPLPLDAAVTRSRQIAQTVELSPDGEWVAVESMTMDDELAGPPTVGSDGFDFRFRASVVNTRTQEVVELGEKGASSDSPSWSPDGKHVAYRQRKGSNPDELWVWDRDAKRSSRIAHVFPTKGRGGYGEPIRWMADSQHFLVLEDSQPPASDSNVAKSKPLPGDILNDLPVFPPVENDQPSVLVMKTESLKSVTGETPTKTQPTGRVTKPPATFRLALVDIQEQVSIPLTPDGNVTWYSPSPDGKRVAYTIHKGWEPTAGQVLQDLMVVDVTTKEVRRVGEDLKLWWGDTVRWSPNSQSLAYVTEGPLTPAGECFVVSATDGVTKKLSGKDTPDFGQKDATGFNFEAKAPLWNTANSALFLTSAKGEAWSLDLNGGAKRIATIDGYYIERILEGRGTETPLAPISRPSLLVFAHQNGGKNAGVFRVDIGTGETTLLKQNNNIRLSSRLYSTSRSKEVALLGESAVEPEDVWLMDPTTAQVHKITHLNGAMERYAMGTTRVIDWKDKQGRQLHGALLLPPDYRPGRRYPLVLWVYGNQNGSESADSFGLEAVETMFNFQVLATRGYAVLFPDTPLTTGNTMRDLHDTAIPGVDKAIELGFADPDRIAVSGYSYGSYSTLSLLVQTPNRFKAAVIGGLRDWEYFSAYVEYGFRATGDVGAFLDNGQGNMGGSPWEFRQRFLDNSPFFYYDQIDAPVLIMQGSRDDLEGADRTYKALRRLKKPAEYRVYEDEGHGFMRAANVIDYWNAQLQFLAEHLNVDTDAKGAVVFEGDHAAGRGKAH